jgi:hypothetical protein
MTEAEAKRFDKIFCECGHRIYAHWDKAIGIPDSKPVCEGAGRTSTGARVCECEEWRPTDSDRRVTLRARRA